MKRKNSILSGWKAMLSVMALFTILTMGLFADGMSIVSHAESAGKITASSAKIRKEPNTSSETLGSAEQNASVSVTGQTTGADGYTWYQVSVDANTKGYVRSDLMKITDGSTPSTIASTSGSSTSSGTTSVSSTATTSTPDETVVDVTAVEPVAGSVSGGSPVRVRQNASTTSRIVNTAQAGMTLTVTGKATGTDGKEWYQVNFISSGSQVNGFIRADYVSLSGELVEAGAAEKTPAQTPEEDQPEPVVETKDWDTYYGDGKWHLTDNTTGNVYDIQQIFSSVEANTQTLQDVLKKNKTQQILLILLVIVVILLAAVISFLIFKLKDAADSAYIEEVEREAERRRTTGRPAGQGSRPASQGNRPAGQGSRPVAQGSRPASQGNRPAGQGSRPASQGNRPAGQGSRPASQGNRPAPQGSRPAPQGNRPAEPVGQKMYETKEPDRVPAYEPQPEINPAPKPAWKSKNFADDGEFEFQFLDWEDDQQ